MLFPIKSIIQHAIKKPGCNSTYSQDHLDSLRRHSKEVSNAKHEIKKAELYQSKKSHYRERYQKNKFEIAAKNKKRKDEAKFKSSNYDTRIFEPSTSG